MSDTKRLKKDAVSTKEADEHQAAVDAAADEEQLENGEDAAGEGGIAATEEELDYTAEDNEFVRALEDVQDKLAEVGADGCHITHWLMSGACTRQ